MTRVLISIPETMLSTIDYCADLENSTRSELLRQAFREFAQKRGYSAKADIVDAELNAKKLEEMFK